VRFSRPYYIASYRIVIQTRRGDLLNSELIGIEEGLALRGLNGHTVKTFPTTEAILKAVAEGQIAAGYVVSTRGAWLSHEQWLDKLVFLPGTEKLDRFPISAAVRKSDDDLRAAIDSAWDVLDKTGKLAQVFTRWHIPYEPPTVLDPKKG
jgi:ABC-type amino acid transport substrate-binding protein